MECSRCGAGVRRGLSVCPVCGARLRKRPRKVRCRHCGHRFSAELTLCPQCGRERQPASPSVTFWAGALIAVLLVVAGLMGFAPLGRWRSALAERVPGKAEVVSWMATALPTLETALVAATPERTGRAPTPTVEPTATPVPEQSTATPTPMPATPTPEPPTPTMTPSLTSTITPTATTTPTSEPTAEAENVYIVVPGDTLSTIARHFGVTVEAIARANDIEDVAQLRVGQRLIIPPVEETPAPTDTPPSPENIVYVVAPGDTLSSIARRFGVTVEEIASLNGIEDTSRLQVNQRLLIPRPEGAPPTPVPTPTPPPTPTPTPTLALVYPAPKLLSPADGTPFSGENSFIELRWQDVGPLQPGEVYVVHLGYLVAPGQVSWFYEDTVQGTGWRVPGAFQTLAPQELGRTFRWYVQVEQIRRDADGRIIARVPRSPRSEEWSFTWR